MPFRNVPMIHFHLCFSSLGRTRWSASDAGKCSMKSILFFSISIPWNYGTKLMVPLYHLKVPDLCITRRHCLGLVECLVKGS